MYDNKTESMRTINLLQRMNIYQEVLLGVLYRALPVRVRRADGPEPRVALGVGTWCSGLALDWFGINSATPALSSQML